jgi:hypothetical protein
VQWTQVPGGAIVHLPYWLLVGISAVVGVAPWIKWSFRFSRRTLLFVTTLVAVGLGLIILAAN